MHELTLSSFQKKLHCFIGTLKKERNASFYIQHRKQDRNKYTVTFQIFYNGKMSCERNHAILSVL